MPCVSPVAPAPGLEDQLLRGQSPRSDPIVGLRVGGHPPGSFASPLDPGCDCKGSLPASQPRLSDDKRSPQLQRPPAQGARSELRADGASLPFSSWDPERSPGSMVWGGGVQCGLERREPGCRNRWWGAAARASATHASATQYSRAD